MQITMLRSGLTPTDYWEVKRHTEMILEAERSFITQKAKLSYLQQGDRCTKFFHALIKRNNKRNAIVAINNFEGSTVTDPIHIADLFVDYYERLLGSHVDRIHIDRDTINDGSCVSSDSWVALSAMVTTDEIKTNLFDIDNEKAPGADGFGSFFYNIFLSCIFFSIQRLASSR